MEATSRKHSGSLPRDADRRGQVGVDLGLSDDEKITLRSIAEQAIRAHCLTQDPPEISEAPPRLQEPRGAFVCIKKGGELRGCIGMIEGREPLHLTIRNMAIQAAFSDPRFCSVQPGELEELSLEISVLTPLERLDSPEDLEIGKHGLYIKRGRYSGLLLPQVATEYGWNQEQFLEYTCQKAGLPLQAWRDPETEIYAFSADIF